MGKRNWKVPLIIVIGIIAVVLSIIFGVQGTSNHAIALEEQVNTAKSDIKVQEKRRVDLVYNLVDCVKEYDKHEANTLTTIAKSKEKIENAQAKVAAIAEAYPELKSDQNYKTLMNELSMTENLLAEYRSNYNSQVKDYNRYVRKFPAKQLLHMLGYKAQNYRYLDYDVSDDAPKNLFEGNTSQPQAYF